MTAPPDTGDHQYTGQCVGGPWDGETFSHWQKLFAHDEDGCSGVYTYEPVEAFWYWESER